MTGAAMRKALMDAGYTTEGVLAVLGADAFAALGRGEAVPARHRLADLPDDPLTDLIRLFLLGEEVPSDRAATALPLDEAMALELIASTHGVHEQVRARAHIQPYPTESDVSYVASDFPAGRRTPMGLHPDHVIGAGGASVTLAAITPRNRVARTFDLGTGCGIQAVLAAGHSSHVVASDRSERALGMAGRTAALSGVSLDLRHGSLFEPVAGETFDLIVANPPFVISPHAHYSYRESPLRADDLSRTVMQQSVGHLAPGGTAVILANWLHTNEQHWRERLASWAPSGCAVWVAQREFLTPPQYVEVWLRDSAELGAPGYEARYAEWLTYLEDIGATGVGFGWIVLHRDGQEWFVAEDLSDAERLPNGQEVTAQLQDFDALHRATAIQLLNSSPRWRDDVELHNSWSPTAGPGTTKLVATGAWRPPEQLDNGVAELLSRDGTLSERIEAQSGHDLEAIDNLTARALVCLRRLIGSGLVSIEG